MNHEFLTYQIIVFVVVAFLILRSLFLVISKRKNIREFFISFLFWGGIGLIGLFPNLAQKFAQLTGFELGINALLVSAVIFLLFCVLSLATRVDKLESSITKLVRELALKEEK